MISPMIFYKPMLACDMPEGFSPPHPYLAFPKIDGVRMEIIGSRLVGRSGKPIANRYLSSLLSKPELDGLIFEFTATYPTAPNCLRASTSFASSINAEPENGQLLYINIFDLMNPSTCRMGYLSRIEASYNTVYNISLYETLISQALTYNTVTSNAGILSLYDAFLEEGYEGLILRDPFARHKDGRCTAREASYMRLKPHATSEGIVLSIVEGNTNINDLVRNPYGKAERSTAAAGLIPSGMLATMVVKDIHTGETHTVSAGKLSHAERKAMMANPSLILGKLITYAWINTGLHNKLRSARFISFRDSGDLS